MNKKEVTEIRKQFAPAECAITRICTCYVDHDKNKVSLQKEAFLSLPEEEEFKYFEIFKQTLSGTVGKNLLTMDFPLAEEETGGRQEFLLRLRNSQLQDDDLVMEFFDKIIESYSYEDNYYIILIYAAYDIPGKTTDSLLMEDASEDVYAHILCSICPVDLAKSGLSFHPETNKIEGRNRDRVVQAPVKGFLFPSFTDRSSNIHELLYYSKNPEELYPELIENVLGSKVPVTAKNQKEIFDNVVASSLGEECAYETVKNIHENLNEMIESCEDGKESLELTKSDMKKLLAESGISQDRLETFEQEFKDNAGEDIRLLAANVANTKKFDIKTPDIEIKVKPERVNLIETRIINNRQCLVITVDDHIEVNGLPVKTILHNREDDQV